MAAPAPAAVITGASRGIGRALADRLARRGPVLGTCRGAHPEDGAGIRWATLDVADPASHHALAERLDGAPVGLLVCNAGIYPDRDESLADGFPPAMWAEAFATNVTGVFLCVQTLLPNLQCAPGARVAIIASQLGSTARASGGSYIYRASKAAAVNLGRNLAADLAGLGIGVGIYHPGWVRTDMGGAAADLDAGTAADGLLARFDALTPDSAGRFESWDGRPLPY